MHQRATGMRKALLHFGPLFLLAYRMPKRPNARAVATCIVRLDDNAKACERSRSLRELTFDVRVCAVQAR
jgi:hypothetical protein